MHDDTSTAILTGDAVDAPSRPMASPSYDKQSFRLSSRCMIAFSLKIAKSAALMGKSWRTTHGIPAAGGLWSKIVSSARVGA